MHGLEQTQAPLGVGTVESVIEMDDRRPELAVISVVVEVARGHQAALFQSVRQPTLRPLH